MTCLTCANWNLRGNTLEQRQMASLRMGLCNLGPRWQFNSAQHQCAQHVPAPADIAEKRRKWLEK